MGGIRLSPDTDLDAASKAGMKQQASRWSKQTQAEWGHRGDTPDAQRKLDTASDKKGCFLIPVIGFIAAGGTIGTLGYVFATQILPRLQ